MFATAKSPSGVLVPMTLNQFEFQRRFLAWQKHQRKIEAKEAIHNTDARRGSFMLRNYGVDKILEMDKASRAARLERERAEAERIADMMAMDAAKQLKTAMCW